VINTIDITATSYSDVTTLSDPFTDGDLEAKVDAAMTALAYPSNGLFSPVASLNWSTDRKTLEKESSSYRPRFAKPKVGLGTCYKIKSATRFTPAGGGAPVYTDITEETWDGTADPGDSTKGIGALRTLAVPAAEGETVVGWYTDPSDHSTFVRDLYGVVCYGCA